MTVEHEPAPVMAQRTAPAGVGRTADAVRTDERVSLVRPAAADVVPVATDPAPQHVHCSGYNVWA